MKRNMAILAILTLTLVSRQNVINKYSAAFGCKSTRLRYSIPASKYLQTPVYKLAFYWREVFYAGGGLRGWIHHTYRCKCAFGLSSIVALSPL